MGVSQNQQVVSSKGVYKVISGCIGFRDSGLGFPKIRGTILRSPQNKDYSIQGSILGPTTLGNYHIR